MRSATWTPTTRSPAPTPSAPRPSWCRWTTGWRPSIRTRRASTTRGRRCSGSVEHAAELGGDPARIAVAGDSAGGNISAVMAQLARDNGGPPLVFQLLWYPSTTGDMTLPSIIENADGPILDHDVVAAFLQWYLPRRDRHQRPSNLPPTLAPANTADLSGLPPAFIGIAEYDPMRDDGARYAELLSAAGVPVELYNAPTLVHGFVSFALVVPAATEATDRGLAALKAALHRGMTERRCSTPAHRRVGRLAGGQSRHGRRDLAAAASTRAHGEVPAVVRRGGRDRAVLRLDRQLGARPRRRIPHPAIQPAQAQERLVEVERRTGAEARRRGADARAGSTPDRRRQTRRPLAVLTSAVQPGLGADPTRSRPRSGWPRFGATRQNCTPRVSAPSTTRLVPVMKLAAELLRNTTALAISCRRRHPAGRIESERGREQFGVVLLDRRPHPAGKVGVARAHRVGPHALAGEVVGEALGVVDDRGLHRAVRARGEVDLAAGHARDGDDRTRRRLPADAVVRPRPDRRCPSGRRRSWCASSPRCPGMASALTLATTPSMPPSAVGAVVRPNPSVPQRRRRRRRCRSRWPRRRSARTARRPRRPACGRSTRPTAPSASRPSTTALPMPRVPPVTRKRLPVSPSSMLVPVLVSASISTRWCRMNVRRCAFHHEFRRRPAPCGSNRLSILVTAL